MQTAKVFKSGGSMAIRIPRSVNLQGVKEFAIKQAKGKIILSPKTQSKWEDMFAMLEKNGGIDIVRDTNLPPQERSFDAIFA